MPTVFEQLGQYLKGLRHPFLRVRIEAHGVLATLSIGTDRTQTVKISLHAGEDAQHDFIRIQSRSFVPNDPNAVAQLLLANAANELGGFALDTSTTPNVVDVVYHVLGDAVDFPSFALTVQRVAELADRYEKRFTGRDEF